MGESSATEFALDPKMEEFETGDIKLVHSTGSVTLRCICGRVVEYGAKAGGLRVVDSARRWFRFGPPADGSSESWVRILGRRVGPCWRKTGDRLGVMSCPTAESGEASLE